VNKITKVTVTVVLPIIAHPHECAPHKKMEKTEHEFYASTANGLHPRIEKHRLVIDDVISMEPYKTVELAVFNNWLMWKGEQK